MKKLAVLVPVLLVIIFLIYFTVIKKQEYNNSNRDQVYPTDKIKEVQIKTNMQIQSSVFENNQKIPSKYTCDGQGVNPELNFLDVPSSAVSLVLIVDDPDAPNGTFTHWVVYNINPRVNKVSENSVPEGGMLGLTSLGKPGFVGPCPPPASQRGESGTHRYFFKLYALDTKLILMENVSKEEVEITMGGHIITNSQIIGLYGRN